MRRIPKELSGTISSIGRLQGTLNFFENRFTARLISLDAPNGEEDTLATFEGPVEDKFEEVGTLRLVEEITEDGNEPAIKNTSAFIDGKKVTLFVFRGA